MKDVIKMLKAIEKDLAKVIKLVGKAPVKIPALLKIKAKSGVSKTEKVRAMLAKGKKPVDIAIRVGVTPAFVYAIRSKDKKEQAVA